MKPFKKAKKLIIKAQAVTSKECSNDVLNEVFDTLKNTPFDKISIPLYSVRNVLFSEEAENTKNITVGYIKKYDADKNEFTVVIYDGFKDKVSAIEDPVIDVVFGVYNDKLTSISKLIILPQ